MQKLILVIGIVSVVFLSGCGRGGGSSSSSSGTTHISSDKEIAQREYIYLYKHILNYTTCQNKIIGLKSYQEKAQIKDLILQHISESTTCSVYEEYNSSVECIEIDSNAGNTNCVVAYNFIDDDE